MSTSPAEYESRLSDVERRTRQQGDDVTSLYELVQDVDRKVTVLDAKVDAGFTAVDAKLDAILGRLNER